MLLSQENDMDDDDMIRDDIPELGDEPDDSSLEPEPEDDGGEGDQFMTDGEADADALASCGWGTDEDYQHGDSCLGCDE
jgi:hypothetical protein